MNRIIIILLTIVVIIGAMVTAIFIYIPDERDSNTTIQKIAVENTITNEVKEEKTTNNINMVETNTNEVRISPNAFITFKETYSKCGHTTEEFVEVPKEFVNLSEDELKEKYKEWSVEKFTDTDIVLTKNVEGSCNEHFIVKDVNGVIKVFQVLDDGTQKEYLVTDIATEYLTDTDKINMEKGIEVNGKQNLNQLIEDYE